MSGCLESALVRIRTRDKIIIGAGFLATEEHVLTCAHVITQALGIPQSTPEAPSDKIYLDFPLVDPGNILTARVISWQPIQPDGKGDIACLQLEEKLVQNVYPVPLISEGNLWEHKFRAFGFPQGHDAGIWIRGILLAENADGWIQILGIENIGLFVQPGFSGTPIWDEDLNGVVGMVVQGEQRTKLRVAFIIKAAELVNILPELKQAWIPNCPYRGLSAFREQDAEFFFGREEYIYKLANTVKKKSVVAVIGASGSGKSSVVFAGLVPQLQQEPDWLMANFRPKSAPFDELATAIMPYLEPDMSEIDRLIQIKKMAKALQDGEIELHHVFDRIFTRHPDKKQFLLIIDQFEELYTNCPKVESERFITVLLETLRSQSLPLKIVLTLRADFFSYVLSNRTFADALEHADIKLGPMNQTELEHVIRGPLDALNKKYGLALTIEDGLATRILDDVGEEPGNLPLLEFALTLLWKKQTHNTLSHVVYTEIGGVENALVKHAEEVYQNFNANEQKHVRKIFTQLVQLGSDTGETRRISTCKELGEENWKLVTMLASEKARLVVTDRDEATDDNRVEVIHEALLRKWKRLQNWINEDREFLLWRQRLRNALEQWGYSKYDEGALLRGAALTEAERWATDQPEKLISAEQDFIQKSITLRDQEKATQERLRRRNTRIAVTIAVIFVLLTGVAGVQWWRVDQQREIALLERQKTLSRQLAAQALNYLDKQFDLALLLSLESYHIRETLEALGLH